MVSGSRWRFPEAQSLASVTKIQRFRMSCSAKARREDSSREILPFISPHPVALAWGDVSESYGLLPGRASRHRSCRRLRLRNAQVPGGAVLGYLVDDQLQRRAAAVRIEVNRLLHRAPLSRA